MRYTSASPAFVRIKSERCKDIETPSRGRPPVVVDLPVPGKCVVVTLPQESSPVLFPGHTLIILAVCIPTAMAQEILCHQRVRLSYKDAFGYVIPVGTTSLMTWVTDEGMIGTEGFDIDALAVFGVPAAIVGVSEESTPGDPRRPDGR